MPVAIERVLIRVRAIRLVERGEFCAAFKDRTLLRAAVADPLLEDPVAAEPPPAADPTTPPSRPPIENTPATSAKICSRLKFLIS